MRCSKLNKAASRLDKLRKTPAALNEQSKALDKAWQLDFVKGLGEQRKAVRDQFKQKAQWSFEPSRLRIYLSHSGSGSRCYAYGTWPQRSR